MEKLNRWIAKHPTTCRVSGMIFWICLGVIWLQLGMPMWVFAVLCFLFFISLWLVLSTCGAYLLKKPLEILQKECDPYPFLKEMNEQRTYPGNDTIKQLREIDYALALRCVGEYEKAFALLSSINIDKHAGMLPNAKVIYYNNLMDLCALMGKHQEAVIWYEKTMQIFRDMKPGKPKEQLRKAVESNRAIVHFCKGEYEQALQALGQVKVENLNDRIENAMMYARTYLAMGEAEKAVRPLKFVSENGNKLYVVTEAKALLEKIQAEESAV